MSLRDRDLGAGELLGRHVGRRAGAQRFTGDAGEAEVGDRARVPRPSSITFAGLKSRWTTPRS